MNDFADLGLPSRFIRVPPMQTADPVSRNLAGAASSWPQRIREASWLISEVRRAIGIGAVFGFGYQMTLGRLIGARRFYLIGGTADELERGVAPVPVKAPEGIAIREISEADWPAIDRFSPAFFRSRVRRAHQAGRIGFGAWRDDTPVGFIWVADTRSIGAELHPLNIPGDLVYFHLLYIAPAERRRGLAAALQCAAITHVHAQGYRRGVAVIETSNGSAIRAALRTISVGMPGQLIGRMTMVQAVRRRYLKWTPPSECPELLRIGVQPNGTLG